MPTRSATATASSRSRARSSASRGTTRRSTRSPSGPASGRARSTGTSRRRDDLLDAIMQSWVDRVNEATDKALAHEGPPRDLLLDWFEAYVGLISLHKGGPAKITSAMGDPDLPDPHQVPGAAGAPASGSVERLAGRGRAARRRRRRSRSARLVGGVATVADNGDLDASRRAPAARGRRRRLLPEPPRAPSAADVAGRRRRARTPVDRAVPETPSAPDASHPRHRRRRRRGPRPRAAVGRARAQGRRVRPDPRDPRPSPDQLRARDVLGDVERALLLQVLQGAPQAVLRDPAGDAGRQDAGRHRRERRRPRHRPGLRRHVQGRVAQPPVVRRALPGRRDRRRRHRPRHPRDGRPPGRGDGPAALRPARRRRHPPRAARDRGRRRRLRQLPRPAQHRRRGGLRRDLRRQPAGQRALRRRAAPRGPPPRQGVRRRQPGDPLRRAHRRRRHRRRPRRSPRETFDETGPAKRPSVQVGDPFMEKLLIECTLELFAAGVVAGIQDLGGAGLSCATSELAAPATAACTSSSTGCPCATPRSRPRRS